MPLIPAQPVAPARDTLSLRLDRDLHEHLKAYAEFVGGSKDYIISQVLQRVLRQDKEFAAWVEARARQNADPPANGRASGDAASGPKPTAATTPNPAPPKFPTPTAEGA